MLLNESQNPLVTLAVFSYNQEKFIREAIEGALSQDYTPLEIILSDDASSDATFEIVEKYAKEYRGPHSLKIRRNYINLGTAMHVSIVGQEAAGAFVVVAAGDDISTSCRVSKIVETWKQYPDAAVIHSGRSTMGAGGESIQTYIPPSTKFIDSGLNILLKSGWLPCAGPTCAYSREIFTRFPALRGGLIEDAPLLLRAGLLGRYVPIEDALVNQRLNCGNSGIGFNLNNPKKWNYFLESKIFAFRAMQRDLSSWPAPVKYGDEISREILNLLISASSLFIPEDRRISILDKATFILRALTSPAFGSSFYHRIKSIPYFVLGDESKIFKVLRLIFNLRLKNNDKHILED